MSALSVAHASTNLVLSWLSPPGDFVLQLNPDLNNANWTVVTNARVVTNGVNQTMVPASAGNLYFRLEYP